MEVTNHLLIRMILQVDKRLPISRQNRVLLPHQIYLGRLRHPEGFLDKEGRCMFG